MAWLPRNPGGSTTALSHGSCPYHHRLPIPIRFHELWGLGEMTRTKTSCRPSRP